MGKHILIHTLGLSHFCIYHNNPIELLKSNFTFLYLTEKQTVKEIDWDFIYGEDDESKNFILLTDLNGWSYLIWKYWDFNTNVVLAKGISKILKTEVNYYFMDSNIATSRWVFTENGIVTRSYYESHGAILVDSGYCKIENEIRKTRKKTFVEDIFWELYTKTCLSLDTVNNNKIIEVNVCIGEFE